MRDRPRSHIGSKLLWRGVLPVTALAFVLSFSRQAGHGSTPTNPAATQQPTSLPVIERPQEGYYTCWATCAEMIMQYLGAGRIRQCEQANLAFNLFTCCTPESVVLRGGGQAAGDAQWRPEFDKWGAFKFRYQQNTHLSWEVVTNEIFRNRPFAMSLPQGTVSHLVVVVGYTDIGGEKRVEFFSPAISTINAFSATSLNPLPSTVSRSIGELADLSTTLYFELRPETDP